MPSLLQEKYRLAGRVADALPAVLRPSPVPGAPEFRSLARLEVESYAQLTGYRAGAAQIQDAFIRAVSASGRDAAVILAVSGGKASVYLGSADDVLPTLCSGIAGELPMAAWAPVKAWDEHCPLFADHPCGGYIGGLSAAALEADALLRAADRDCVIGLAIRPCPRETLQETQLRAQRLAELTGPFCTRTIPRGSGGTRSMQQTDRRIAHAGELLGALCSRLSGELMGKAYQAALWFAAGTPEDADRVGTLLLEALRAGEEKDEPLSRKPYIQPMRDTTMSFDGIYLPYLPSAELPAGCDLPLLRNALTALLPEAELRSLLPLPRDSHPGFSVTVPIRDETSFHEFDTQPHRADGPSIALGKITETGEEERVSLSAIGEHMLLCGASGSGKGYTIRRLITGLAELHIPFVMFESVKFEFSDLPDYGVDLRIYSSGITGQPLRFNPFIPESMTMIYSHIKGLVAALTAASDNLAPIPQALEMVICEAYRRHGWGTEDRVLPGDTRTFPTFPEVVGLIRPFFRESDLYQGEVKTNVASALYTRLSALAGFSFLSGREKLPTEEILSRSTSIQFDGLDVQADKCFLANVLLLNLNEALRKEPLDGGLRRVFILDEAHNFFLKPSDQSSSSASVSQYLGNLLSEIRANGCGIIIADQRPDCLNPCVLENTKVKIAHALAGQADIAAVSGQLGLSPNQLRLYHALAPGQAIVCVRGQRQVVRIQVEKPEPLADTRRIAMCGFCGFRHLCCSRDAAARLEGFPVKYSCQRLSGSMADPDALRAITREILSEAGLEDAPPHLRQCFFGQVAEGFGNPLYRQFFDSFYTTQFARERRNEHE